MCYTRCTAQMGSRRGKKSEKGIKQTSIDFQYYSVAEEQKEDERRRLSVNKRSPVYTVCTRNMLCVPALSCVRRKTKDERRKTEREKKAEKKRSCSRVSASFVFRRIVVHIEINIREATNGQEFHTTTTWATRVIPGFFPFFFLSFLTLTCHQSSCRRLVNEF